MRADFRAGLVLVILTGLCAGCRPETGNPPLILATTTSVSNSGLLDQLLRAYDRPVRVVAAGSGLALDLFAKGEAEVAITHAPDRERDALTRHPHWKYRKVCWNEFVIVGPEADPAKIRAATTASQAMQLIASSGVRFTSRGDDSGTAEREQRLWAAAGTRPARDRLVVAGASMGQTLRIASVSRAYTLTDEGTFLALVSSVDLKVLYRGDPELVNTYAVTADPSRVRGLRFADWLSEGAGHAMLRDLLERGTVRGFTLWPAGRPNQHPSDSPQ